MQSESAKRNILRVLERRTLKDLLSLSERHIGLPVGLDQAKARVGSHQVMVVAARIMEEGKWTESQPRQESFGSRWAPPSQPHVQGLLYTVQ
jgi:hypothetical protein